MWSTGVVLSTPQFDDNLGFLQRVKDFPVEQLISEFAIE
jgi:hypothetical protein